MRDTSYATELATAEVENCRIERLHVKAEGQVEIRFSWWPDGKMANWPAPGSEDTELGVLMELEVRHGETEVYPRVQA